jgi:hypothetical protein
MSAVVMGGCRFGMIIARPAQAADSVATVFSTASSRRCRCMSHGFLIVSSCAIAASETFSGWDLERSSRLRREARLRAGSRRSRSPPTGCCAPAAKFASNYNIRPYLCNLLSG